MCGNFKWMELWNQFRVMFAINVMVVLVMMGIGVIVPIIPLYGESFGVSAALIGFLITSFGLARMFVNIPAGIFAEKYGRKLVLVGGILILAVSSLFCGIANGYWQLVIWRFIQGVGSAAYTTVAMTVVADISSGSNRGRNMALYQGSILVGTGLGPSLGGFISGYTMSYRTPFFLFSALAFAGAIWSWFMLPETRCKLKNDDESIDKEKNTRTTPSAGNLLKNRDFLLIGLVNFVVFFTRAGTRLNLLPLIGALQVGLRPEQIGISLTIAALADFIILPIIGFISDKYGRKIVIITFNLLTALFICIMQFSDNFSHFLFAVLLFGSFSVAGGTLPAAYVADIAPRNQYGIAMGVFRTFGDIGFVIAPVLLGTIVDLWGYGTALYFNAFLMAGVSVYFGFYAKETNKMVKANVIKKG